jgi:hypothetical protein
VSGLPDEAVEAIWMTLRERFGIDADLRRIPVEDVVAALPAGVYVSDGQGHVTRSDALQEVAEYRARESAALSATDTEKAPHDR